MSHPAPELPDDLTHATTPEVRRFKVDLGNFLDRSVQFSLISLFVISLGIVLYLGQYVFAPLLAGILVGFTLGPLSSRLERFGLQSAISAFMIVVSLFALIVGLFNALALPLESWSARLPQVGRQLTAHWENIRKPIEKLKEVEEEVAEAGSEGPRTLEVTIKQEGVVSNAISSAPDVIARMVMFIVTL